MTIREFFKSVRGKGLLVIALNKSRQTLLMDTASAKGIRYDKPKVDNSTKRDLSDVLMEICAKGESIDKQFLLQLQQLSDMRMIAMNLINIITDDERKPYCNTDIYNVWIGMQLRKRSRIQRDM